jgi:hypothetical protein
MSDTLSKVVQWFLYAMLGISALFGVLFYLDIISENLLLNWGYVLLGVTILATLIAAFSNILLKPKGSLKILLILAIMVVVAIVSYFLSTNEFTTAQLEKLQITETTSKLVGAGLFFTYFLAAVALLAIVYSAVSRMFK